MWVGSILRANNSIHSQFGAGCLEESLAVASRRGNEGGGQCISDAPFGVSKVSPKARVFPRSHRCTTNRLAEPAPMFLISLSLRAFVHIPTLMENIGFDCGPESAISAVNGVSPLTTEGIDMDICANSLPRGNIEMGRNRCVFFDQISPGPVWPGVAREIVHSPPANACARTRVEQATTHQVEARVRGEHDGNTPSQTVGGSPARPPSRTIGPLPQTKRRSVRTRSRSSTSVRDG